MKTTRYIMASLNMKTTSEDDLKYEYEDDLKHEDGLKYEDDLKYEDSLKYKNNLK